MVLSTNFKTLLEVAGQGSFVGASQALGISAAAVSKQIKKLEEQLGFLLFHRSLEEYLKRIASAPGWFDNSF